jgi:ribosomal protein S12 methylthiotransferase accessory factor YcaO
MKLEARNRTMCEVLERTFLAELQFPLDKTWGSAIAPTVQLAQYVAIEECLERWITYQAWARIAGFRLVKISIDDFASLDFLQAILFEWERYGAKLELFLANNPYNLPVVLVRIQFLIGGKQWTFFSNGIGNSLSLALIKAFLESIQFVPGKR